MGQIVEKCLKGAANCLDQAQHAGQRIAQVATDAKVAVPTGLMGLGVSGWTLDQWIKYGSFALLAMQLIIHIPRMCISIRNIICWIAGIIGKGC